MSDKASDKLCRRIQRDLDNLLADVVAVVRPETRADEEAFVAEGQRIMDRVNATMGPILGNRSPDADTTRSDLRYILLAHFRVLTEELEKA